MFGLKQIAEIARRAAEVIQKRGKATGVFMDPTGKVCTVGAIRVAMAEQGLGYTLDEEGKDLHPSVPIAFPMGTDNARRAEMLICERIESQVQMGVTNWSDHPRTTAEDIAKRLNQAADEIEVL